MGQQLPATCQAAAHCEAYQHHTWEHTRQHERRSLLCTDVGNAYVAVDMEHYTK
jgi:hypothetical protein